VVGKKGAHHAAPPTAWQGVFAFREVCLNSRTNTDSDAAGIVELQRNPDVAILAACKVKAQPAMSSQLSPAFSFQDLDN
jgi:hypothetical protein